MKMSLIFEFCLMIFVCWMGASAAFRGVPFATSMACDVPYGIPLSEQTDVWSFVTCTILCLDVVGCHSVTYNPDPGLCKFNGDRWLSPTAGCNESIRYAEKQCHTGVSSCTDPINDIRLCDGGGTGARDPAQGRVEVLNNGEWGTVCDDHWVDIRNPNYTSIDLGKNNPNIVCQMLGYSSGVAYLDAHFCEGTGPIWMDNVNCSGSEMSLSECPFGGWGDNNCKHDEDAGVRCYL